jgi:hypothetical protein
MYIQYKISDVQICTTFCARNSMLQKFHLRQRIMLSPKMQSHTKNWLLLRKSGFTQQRYSLQIRYNAHNLFFYSTINYRLNIKRLRRKLQYL